SKLELALAEAHDASAAKDRFIGIVSHELRTPLAAAMGYTELLLNPRAVKQRAEPVPILEKILTACKHQLSLVNDLLDLNRYTSGKEISLDPATFSLGPFLKGVVEMAAPLARKNRNRFLCDLPDDLGEVNTDETRLRQVLLNLLSNASKFTEDGEVELV